MVRGKIFFRCYDCENVFEAYDIEYNMTVFSTPVLCHSCGSRRTYPTDVFSKIPIIRDVKLWQEKLTKVPIYKGIWKKIENNKNQ